MGAAVEPFPGTDPRDDLDTVITNLTPKATRQGEIARDPNEPETRWLLDAAVAELMENFIDHTPGQPMRWQAASPIFKAFSLDKVMARFKETVGDLDTDIGQANKSRILTRWGTAGRFQGDVLNYVYRPATHDLRMADIRSDLLPVLLRMSLGELVEALATQESIEVPETPIFRLQGALPLLFPKDRAIRERSARIYRQQVHSWAGIYEEIAGAYRIDITPSGFTMVDVASMFNVVVDGVFTRRVSALSLGLTESGVELEVAMIQGLLSYLAGRPWAELRELQVHAAGPAD